MEKWEERNFIGNSELHIFQITLLKTAFSGTWRSGYCYLNKGGYNLNQSKDSLNNSWNNGDRHKIHEIFLITCFVFAITLAWKTVHSSAMTQTEAHLKEKTLQLTDPILAGWTKKPFDHYAILKLFSLRSPSTDFSIKHNAYWWFVYDVIKVAKNFNDVQLIPNFIMASRTQSRL